MYFVIQKNLRIMGKIWMFVDSVDKSISLIIQNHAGDKMSLDQILKFGKNVWIKVDSFQTRIFVNSKIKYIKS